MKGKEIEKKEKRAKLIVKGAREHNLKNINIEIPRNQLTVVTGLSGSGKSSLAFDTIYAEGNRRYLETFSAYSRGFIGKLERPDVDKITGLSPVISIEQKTTSNNPRSTVGTTTELYDFLRLLYARTATAYSLKTGKPLVNYSEEQIYERIIDTFEGKKVYLLAPVVRDRKGHYRELLENMRRRGYMQARIDGVLRDLIPGIQLERYKSHHVEVLVDKLKISSMRLTERDEALNESAMRIKESLRTALRLGKDVVAIQELGSQEIKYFSHSLMDEDTGQSIPDPAPHTFSFNSPIGSCPRCKGIGSVPTPDMDKIIPNGKESIRSGALAPLGKYRPNMIFKQLGAITAQHGFTIDDPINSFTEELLNDIISGVDYPLKLEVAPGRWERLYSYDGLASYIQQISEDTESSKVRKWAEQFNTYTKCPACKGKRLKPESLSFKIGGLDIAEVAAMPLPELQQWIQEVPNNIEPIKYTIGYEIAKEINSRVQFLLDVGLDYLTLDRSTGSLSGGETQRIRLGTQLGSQLVNALYILDEPSIGLHQRDNDRLIQSLKKLRDVGNTLIVVEHDRDIMLNADHLIDLGPRAGRSGGHVTFSGSIKELLHADTLTAAYIQREKEIELPQKRRAGNGSWLRLMGARGNNLKGETLSIPLGTFTCITGVSGSGKSSYINDTLYPALSKHFYRSHQEPLPYNDLEGA